MITVTMGQASSGFWTPAVFSAAITATTALITGIVIATIAWRQWKTAKDKLALDLFDRRFDAYKAVLAAIEARQDEIRKGDIREQAVDGWPETEALSQFWRESSDARFLFGDDVDDILDLMNENLRDQAKAHLEFQTKGVPSYEVYMRSVMAMWALTDKLRRTVELYMKMGHISVARPAKTRRRR